MEEKITYPSDDYASAAYPPPQGMCSTPKQERLTSTRDLMTLAESIAVMVKVQVPRGSDRCRLRAMVQMFLDD